MSKLPAQTLYKNEQGELFIQDDWYPKPLPKNILLDDMSYPDTSYSFTTFFSEKKDAFSLGYASGNYGHGIFSTGRNGEIKVGKYVVLQCTRIISNLSVTIHDHCMFSWGSVITDSWITPDVLPAVKRRMLEKASEAANRQVEFENTKPVVIEENVWIGFEAIILPGVTVGRGAIIGSKTVVSEDVPPYAVVVGNPQKIIKFLEPTDREISDDIKGSFLK
jgi:acetyltransferase-like isoleucine patch superfamily enzyme